MQQWEHRVVRSWVTNVGKRVKREKGRGLDPEIEDWLALTWNDGQGGDVARLAWWDEKECWTTVPKIMALMGEDGWELVSISESHDQPGGTKNPDPYNPFSSTTYEYTNSLQLYFKRPKQ